MGTGGAAPGGCQRNRGISRKLFLKSSSNLLLARQGKPCRRFQQLGVLPNWGPRHLREQAAAWGAVLSPPPAFIGSLVWGLQNSLTHSCPSGATAQRAGAPVQLLGSLRPPRTTISPCLVPEKKPFGGSQPVFQPADLPLFSHRFFNRFESLPLQNGASFPPP